MQNLCRDSLSARETRRPSANIEIASIKRHANIPTKRVRPKKDFTRATKDGPFIGIFLPSEIHWTTIAHKHIPAASAGNSLDRDLSWMAD